MQTLTITRPDDWHTHLRDDAYLLQTVADISRYFGRAIVMPNLTPPVRTVAEASAYRARILSVRPDGSRFEPLMTLYLTDDTTPATIAEAAASGIIPALKLYPAGVTTNSDAGVRTIEQLYPVFESMQTHGLVLAIHGEVNDDAVDIFDREAVFIERHLREIATRFPDLKIVLEHITTRDAVQFVAASSGNIAATITAHHLLYNRNHLLAGGMKPIYYCLPVLKRSSHQQALIEAAVSGNPRFFLGTDSAPHPRAAKEDACGCAAGSYTAHAAIELYAEVFESMGKLDALEAFASHNGPDFYGLPRNHDSIELVRQSWQVDTSLNFGDTELIPIRGGEPVMWTVKNTVAEI